MSLVQVTILNVLLNTDRHCYCDVHIAWCFRCASMHFLRRLAWSTQDNMDILPCPSNWLHPHGNLIPVLTIHCLARHRRTRYGRYNSDCQCLASGDRERYVTLTHYCIERSLMISRCTAESRGEHVSAFGIYCGLGLIVCLWLEFGCSYIDSSASWRFPLALPVLFSAIVMAFIFSLPESPR